MFYKLKNTPGSREVANILPSSWKHWLNLKKKIKFKKGFVKWEHVLLMEKKW